MQKKHFIIVGSMKCGTTSLHHWLSLSQNIFIPKGETHFFNREDRYDGDYNSYLQQLGTDSNDSLKLLGDDTPTYSYLEKVPQRINWMLPNVRILWILRDPLERAVSNYWHGVRAGIETRSINDAFRDEIIGKEKNIWRKYIKRSEYLWQIENYMEYFDRDQICFIDFEKFTKGTQGELDKITEFLEIGDCTGKIPHSNETAVYPNPRINWLICKLNLPSRFATMIRKIFSQKEKTALSREIEVELDAQFKKYNPELFKVTALNIFANR